MAMSLHFLLNISLQKNNGTKDVETIMLLSKYVSNFWGTLEIPLTDYEIDLDQNWSKKCVLVDIHVANQEAKFSITDVKILLGRTVSKGF